MKTTLFAYLAFLSVGAMTLAPVTATAAAAAQSHRQKQKNDWRNLGYLGAAVGIYGLATHQDTLTAIGAIGAIYAGSRYEEERKHQKMRQRTYHGVKYVSYGPKTYRYHNHLYKRTSWNHNGQTWYTYVPVKG